MVQWWPVQKGFLGSEWGCHGNIWESIYIYINYIPITNDSYNITNLYYILLYDYV